MRTLRLLLIVAGLSGSVVRADEAAPVGQVERPALVSAQAWGSEPLPIPDARRQRPRLITIHHAGVFVRSTLDPMVFVKNMQTWGKREKEWPDLPYHFLIAPDGRIFEGRPLTYEPESNTDYGLNGHVGVELMGDFTRQRVSPEQLESLVKITTWLCATYEIDPAQIAGHNDRAPGQTACPGTDLHRYIAEGQLQAWVRDGLAGGEPEVVERDAVPDGPTIHVGDPAGDPPTTQPAN